MQSLRIGLNYRLGPDLSKSDVFTKGVPALDTDNFNIHGQTTFVGQYAFPFRAPYSGQNSLAPNAGRETLDVDLYIGFRPWNGAEIWIDPEIDQGFGLSSTFGVAGFPSAEAYKVGATYPYARSRGHFCGKRSILAAILRKSMRGSISLPVPRPPTELSLQQASSASSTFSTETNMRMIRAATS